MLVDKDQQLLLQNYDKLGFSQEALDAATKDKFLVQSCALLPEFSHLSSTASGGSSKEEAEQLTSMWNTASSNKFTAVMNKKLLVRHMVVEGEGKTSTASSAAAAIVAAAAASKTNNSGLALPGLALPEESHYAKMTPEMLVAEVSALRKKYDDLVMFSVNLTAERDILNNSLEQTRRDLEKIGREKESVAKMKNTKNSKSGGFGFVFVFIVSVIMFLLGKHYNSLITGQRDEL